jgi:hypothetical protein
MVASVATELVLAADDAPHAARTGTARMNQATRIVVDERSRAEIDGVLGARSAR